MNTDVILNQYTVMLGPKIKCLGQTLNTAKLLKSICPWWMHEKAMQKLRKYAHNQ